MQRTYSSSSWPLGLSHTQSSVLRDPIHLPYSPSSSDSLRRICELLVDGGLDLAPVRRDGHDDELDLAAPWAHGGRADDAKAQQGFKQPPKS
ncbi:hypothetical protein TIFTF001_017060 [Ficus carica]|uniref:Uncharacterized protein n=1 Tax=Ficus carica TaxID=3494 RepID=A0AA88D6Q6_FICCA|nr:hypothetical protein TIFTF001_017060 [Ficus carica]